VGEGGKGDRKLRGGREVGDSRISDAEGRGEGEGGAARGCKGVGR